MRPSRLSRGESQSHVPKLTTSSPLKGSVVVHEGWPSRQGVLSRVRLSRVFSCSWLLVTCFFLAAISFFVEPPQVPIFRFDRETAVTRAAGAVLPWRLHPAASRAIPSASGCLASGRVTAAADIVSGGLLPNLAKENLRGCRSACTSMPGADLGHMLHWVRRRLLCRGGSQPCHGGGHSFSCESRKSRSSRLSEAAASLQTSAAWAQTRRAVSHTQSGMRRLARGPLDCWNVLQGPKQGELPR